MRVTKDLAEIVKELRDANEAWEHSALLGESDAERVHVGERLSDAVSELEGWLDTRGPKALQSPHQGPTVGDGSTGRHGSCNWKNPGVCGCGDLPRRRD